MWTRVIVALALLLWSGPSIAGSGWVVDQAASQLEYTVDIGGSIATGRFDAWTAEIHLDPERPEEGCVRVEIEMDSVFIDDARAQAVDGPAWLGVEGHPKATFQSDRLDLTGNGELTVTGRLTLKDLEAPLKLSGALIFDGLEARADLSGLIMRLSHHVGVGQDAVAAKVTVQATVTARQTPE